MNNDRFIKCIAFVLILFAAIILGDKYESESISPQSNQVSDSILFSPIMTGVKEFIVPDSLMPLVKNNPVFELLVSETGAIESVSVIRSCGRTDIDSLVKSQLLHGSFPPSQKGNENVAIRIQWEYRFRQAAPRNSPVLVDSGFDTFPAHEIVVYGRELYDAPQKLILRKNEIARLPGYVGDPVKMLEILPATSQTAFDGIMSSALCVRGGGPDDSRYFIDGIPLLRLNHIVGIQSLYNPDGLRSVEFYPGNFGVRYGDAVSGVINFSLDTARAESFEGYADLSLLNGSLVARTPVQGNASLFFSLRRSWIGDIAPVVISHDDWKMYFGDINISYSWRINAAQKLAVLFIGATLSNKKQESRPRYIRAYDSSYYRYVNPSQYSDTQSYYRAVNSYPAIDTPLIQDLHLGYKVYCPAVQLESSFNENVSNLFQASFTPAVATTRNFDTIYAKTRSRSYFCRDEIRLSIKKANFLIGIEPAARVTMKFRPIDRLTLFGAVGNYSKDQDLMYAYNIIPQRASHYSTGIECRSGKRFSCDIALYFQRQWNIQEYVIEKGSEMLKLGGVRYDGRWKMGGAELFFTYMGEDSTLAVVSYSLSRSQRWSFEANRYVPYEKDRRHNLKAASSVPFPRGFELGAGIRISSGAPKYPTVRQIWYEDKGYFDFIQYRIGTGRFSPYFALDLKVAQKFRKNRMQWYIDIKNINALVFPSIEYNWAGMYFDYERQEWKMEAVEENCHKQQIYPAAGFRVNF